jgi:tetratricopeptide (TPR) repeat protein
MEKFVMIRYNQKRFMTRKHYKKTEINLNKSRKQPSVLHGIENFGKSLFHEEKILLTAIVSALVCFCLIIFASIDLSQSISVQKNMKKEKDRVAYELSYWQEIVKLHPDYRDGYFKLALIQYRLGKTKQSRENVEKAMEIDPNFSEGKEFEKMLESSD